MTDHDDVTLQIVTERFERRLAEERGSSVSRWRISVESCASR